MFKDLLYTLKKLDIIEREVQKFSITGICKTHWSGSVHCTSKNGNTIYYSRHRVDSVHRLAVIVPCKYYDFSFKILTIKINAKPCLLNIVHVFCAYINKLREWNKRLFQNTWKNYTINSNTRKLYSGILLKNSDKPRKRRPIVGSYGLGGIMCRE